MRNGIVQLHNLAKCGATQVKYECVSNKYLFIRYLHYQATRLVLVTSQYFIKPMKPIFAKSLHCVERIKSKQIPKHPFYVVSHSPSPSIDREKESINTYLYIVYVCICICKNIQIYRQQTQTRKKNIANMSFSQHQVESLHLGRYWTFGHMAGFRLAFSDRRYHFLICKDVEWSANRTNLVIHIVYMNSIATIELVITTNSTIYIYIYMYIYMSI